MKNFLIFLASLAALALIAFLIEDLVRQLVVIPLLYFWRLFVVVLGLCPQAFYWALLVLVLLALSIGSILRTERETSLSSEPRTENPGPVARWDRWVRNLSRGNYFKAGFAQVSGRLILEALAQREQLADDQVKERLQAGQLDVPSDIRAYVIAGLTPRSYLFPPESNNRTRREKTPLDLPVSRLVEFLEAKMDEMEERR